MDSITRSYIEQTNRFMQIYNNEFINIQNKLFLAEEEQKVLIFKTRKLAIMIDICKMLKKPQEVYRDYQEQVKGNKKKIAILEKVISRCSKEFEECKYRREKDFLELFDITNGRNYCISYCKKAESNSKNLDENKK